mgnify:CR=1 FL=1|tara:strand:- start:1713 stop:2087 length:375 start_codon:yes stop_codon:yes gene_type:complete
MPMKLIIAGGRDYVLDSVGEGKLNRLRDELGVSKVVCGCARGADTEGEEWAVRNEIDVVFFPADWDKFGGSAGFIRNIEMAKVADAVVLFPGGKGTAHMYKEASRLGLKIFDYRGASGTTELFL